MTALLCSDDDGTLFVSGCVRNQGKFLDRFDAVVLLSAPPDVILERVAHRITNLRQDPRRTTPDPGAHHDGRASAQGS